MNDSVLVFGASGFIGRHLALAIAATGRPVIAASRLPLQFSHRLIKNVTGNFDDPAQFLAVLAECGDVIHAASSSTPGSTEAKPQLDGNLRPTLALIEALQEHPNCRLVYLSSGGTLYGDSVQPAQETDPLRPRSYHGAGKAAAEHFIHAWATQYAGRAVVLRPSNIYGPGQYPRSGFGVVSAAFECCLKKREMTIWGDGTTVRDYLFIEDFVELVTSILRSVWPLGVQTYNASRNEGTSLNQLLARIERVTGQSVPRRYVGTRRVDIGVILLDNAAVRARLSWTPMTSLDTGLQRTWQWFRESA